MPGFFDDVKPPQRQGFFGDLDTTVPSAPEDDDSSLAGWGLAGGAALLAGAVFKNPSLAKTILKKGNAARLQSMLSGLAIPKGALGSAGAATNLAAETRSWKPLKEMFSRQTVRDFRDAYKAHAAPAAGPTGYASELPGPMPGRILGAMDTASQKALQRGGASKEYAEAAMFQQPLKVNYGKFGDTLDSSVARHVVPFRRTPFNQAAEGLKTFKDDYAHKGTRNVYTAAGALHGSLTAEDDYPVSLPLATAFASKYGLAYGGGAILGRFLSGGNQNSGVAGTMIPVSEYGIQESITNPAGPFFDPAFTRVPGKFF